MSEHDPYLPYQRGSETSLLAAEEMPRERALILRERVYRAIADAGERGMTDDELQVELALEGSTERPRRVELVQSHRIVDSGAWRRTRSGRRAAVWIVAPPQQAAFTLEP